MAGVVLSWAGVGKDFPLPGLSRARRPALAGVDLAIRAGERVVLLGPNGSGKSTLLRLAVGLVHPDRGTVRLRGLDPRRARARRGVGYLPELPPGDPQAPARELVRASSRLAAAGRRGRGAGEQEAALEALGMAGRARAPLRSLSRGLRQRAVLAAVLAAGPDLLVLDEPCAGLDAAGREQAGELLESWQAGGRTLLMASHRWGRLERASDRVVILWEGKACWEGSPAEVEARGVGGRPGLVFRSRAERDRAAGLVAGAGVAAEAVEPGEDFLENLFKRLCRESGSGEEGDP